MSLPNQAQQDCSHNWGVSGRHDDPRYPFDVYTCSLCDLSINVPDNPVIGSQVDAEAAVARVKIQMAKKSKPRTISLARRT